ncbi:MAG: HAD-IA family hydrolase [Myxococcales bacterium]|nr:HAD-IA family hydrolase [Myxococcales bacterium]
MSGPPQHALPLPRARPGTALLLDAAGTLLHPSAPVAETYAHHAQRFGVAIDSSRIAARFPAAFAEARPLRRNAPDWRDFWSVVVARSTGCDDPSLVDALVEHFAGPRAWTLAADARTCCEAVRERGMKVAIVSNWDLHLRPLLRAMKVLDWVDLLLVSAEEGLEKPEPALFHRACARLGVEPNAALHVGNDPGDDLAGARAAGCPALLLGPARIDASEPHIADFPALTRLLLSPPSPCEPSP